MPLINKKTKEIHRLTDEATRNLKMGLYASASRNINQIMKLHNEVLSEIK